MNLTQGSYLNTPEEQIQQFIETFIFKFRPHSQTNFFQIFKSLAGYQNYHLQSILAQKRDHRLMNLTYGSYMHTPEGQLQQIYRNVHHHVQAPYPNKVFTGYSYLQLDIGITIFRAFQLKNKIRHMNLDSECYLNTLEEQFQQFIEKFIIKFRPHSQSKFLRDIQISSWILEFLSLEHSSSNKRSLTNRFD